MEHLAEEKAAKMQLGLVCSNVFKKLSIMFDCLIKSKQKWQKMDHFIIFHPNLHINQTPFLPCTITFKGPPLGSQLGPAFAKAGTAPKRRKLRADYKASRSRRWHTSCSPLWKPYISYTILV